MYLIVGLGNPGTQYRATRHNFGFFVVDYLAGENRLSFHRGEGPFEIAMSSEHDPEFILAKPMTYMNRSGIAVDDLVKRYHVALNKILIICDDLSLPPGKIRLRSRGSDGGHNGLASVINYLRSSDFARLRLGVGHPDSSDVIPFVLSRFNQGELKMVDETVKKAGLVAISFITENIQNIMNRTN